MSACREADWPETPSAGSCCMGAAVYGPGRCTCWEPVFNIAEQAEPLVEVEPRQRRTLCGDCAYRPDSPERTGARFAGADEDDLRNAATGGVFWCHDGLRTPVAWVHPPSGMRIDARPGDYRPPVVDGVPYRGDGRPADRCGGWAAWKRSLANKA